MAEIDDLLAYLPTVEIAARVEAEPYDVQEALAAIVPAIVAGLEANAADPAGAASLTEALDQHTSSISVAEVDTSDGEAIARHVFGPNLDQVMQQLASKGVSENLIRKLLPVIAPLLLSFLAQRSSGNVTNVLKDLLNSYLGSGTETQTGSSGSIIDILGGLLGAGRR